MNLQDGSEAAQSGSGIQAATSDVPARIERDGPSDRHHMRVELNSLVTLNGAPFELRDVSIGGIGIRGVAAGATLGTSVVEISLPCHGFELKLALPVIPVWRSPDSGRAGLRFLELTRSQSETLRYLIESHLSGRLISVDGVLAEGGGTSAQRKIAAAGQKPLPRFGKTRRIMSLTASIAAGALILALAGVLAYDRITILETKLAAVSAPTLDVKAPVDGALDGRELPKLKVGAAAAKGDVVFEMTDNELRGDLEVAAAELDRDRVRLKYLEREAQIAGVVETESIKSGVSNVKLARNAAKRARREAEMADQRFAKTKQLFAEKVVALAELDADESLRLAAQTKAETAERELAEAEARSRLLGEGFDTGMAKTDVANRLKLEQSVAMARADVAVREARSKALNLRREDLQVRSPCDCVVESVHSAVGEQAKKGDLVLRLRPRESHELTVDALISQDDADRITIGAVSEIMLPSNRTPLSGRVVEINRVPKSQKRLGLPDRPQDLQNYARVVISPSKVLTGVELGMPVGVRLRSNALQRLTSSFASVFFGDEEGAHRVASNETL